MSVDDLIYFYFEFYNTIMQAYETLWNYLGDFFNNVHTR